MEQDRRKFLATSLTLAVSPMFAPRSAWGANDRLAYAVIGTGGRGRYLSQNFQKLGAECVAVCDVYAPNVEKALVDAPGARSISIIANCCGRRGIDAVVIATPDHQHIPADAALDARKDVDPEKPMSKSWKRASRSWKPSAHEADRPSRDAAPQRRVAHQGQKARG